MRPDAGRPDAPAQTGVGRDDAVDAVVLAGGPADPALTGAALPKAFALIGSSTMVERVIAALRRAPQIRRVAVVGPDPMPPAVAAAATLTVPAAGGLLENLAAGLEALGHGASRGATAPDGAAPVLVAAADAPLLTADAVAAFLREAQAARADAAYAIVPRDAVTRAAPGVRKTFVRVAEGEFTGGSLVLLRPGAFARARPVIERAVGARKRPWELARLFGLGTLLGLATGRLRIAALERRAELIAGLRARAIICREAGVALDVDTPEMLAFVRQRLAGTCDGAAVPASAAGGAKGTS